MEGWLCCLSVRDVHFDLPCTYVYIRRVTGTGIPSRCDGETERRDAALEGREQTSEMSPDCTARQSKRRQRQSECDVYTVVCRRLHR